MRIFCDDKQSREKHTITDRFLELRGNHCTQSAMKVSVILLILREIC